MCLTTLDTPIHKISRSTHSHTGTAYIHSPPGTDGDIKASCNTKVENLDTSRVFGRNLEMDLNQMNEENHATQQNKTDTNTKATLAVMPNTLLITKIYILSQPKCL